MHQAPEIDLFFQFLSFNFSQGAPHLQAIPRPFADHTKKDPLNSFFASHGMKQVCQEFKKNISNVDF